MTATTTTSVNFPPAAQLFNAVQNRFGYFFKMIATAYAVSEERRSLSRLTDQQLRDIGVTKAERQKECGRSAIDFPQRTRW